MKPDAKKLIVYIPDTRGVTVSRFGHGNMKIGPNVFTYSRLPGSPERSAVGLETLDWPRGTCPGSSDECEAICYARRPVAEGGIVYRMWLLNSVNPDAPTEFPDGCELVRLHVSGDFDTVRYIESWIRLCEANPQVTVWGYTRSWRVPELLPALERLRALPNVQLFASMDVSIPELPPEGWRRAWIDGDARLGHRLKLSTGKMIDGVVDHGLSLVCPEETGHSPNCEDCGFCFRGQRRDVTFLRH